MENQLEEIENNVLLWFVNSICKDVDASLTLTLNGQKKNRSETMTFGKVVAGRTKSGRGPFVAHIRLKPFA
ncbi:hypothetical protein NPIL_384581 [Nephila pilipes]|uniref:Uncharacterized protein n=1 Tax=Nephila pilipes TaxID=299642 RepID=A0A8X6QNH1_NEPPI|nr:hypothetical protein NPIL_384581 [Nephila pilipes]